jgi:hypothetical protein
MKLLVTALSAALLSWSAVAQTTASSSGPTTATATLPNGTTIIAALSKSVDSRHVKAGDELMAKVVQDVVSGGKIVIPRNSKLPGHVTEASARGNGAAQSTLALSFDRAVLKDGEQIPLALVIQALAAPTNPAVAPAWDRAQECPLAGPVTRWDEQARPRGATMGPQVPGRARAHEPVTLDS